MSVEPRPHEVEVRGVPDHVEVTGLSEADVKRAISLLQAAGEAQLSARADLRSHLHTAMLRTAMPLVPTATQRQAQRRAAHRETLLAEHSYETHASLTEKRQSRESSVRAWVARHRDRGTLFTLKIGGQTVIPAVQLTEEGQLNTPVTDLVQTLRGAGMDGWSLWGWLCSPSGLLSGEVPAQVAQDNPARALKAAQRTGAELRPAADAGVRAAATASR